jgi:hypothetical protein
MALLCMVLVAQMVHSVGEIVQIADIYIYFINVNRAKQAANRAKRLRPRNTRAQTQVKKGGQEARDSQAPRPGGGGTTPGEGADHRRGQGQTKQTARVAIGT